MKSLLGMKVLLLAVVLNAGLQNLLVGQQHWPRDFQNVGANFFEFGAKAYDRPGDDIGVPILTNGITNSVLLDSNDLTDLGGGAGAEVRFGSVGRRGQKWEFRSFVANWTDNFFFDQSNIVTPFAQEIFDAVGGAASMIDIDDLAPDTVDIEYDSEIYSFELSIKRNWLPGVTFITGPRFISFNEELEFNSDSTFMAGPLGTMDFDTENTFETRNALLGAQIGALVNIPISRDIYINGFIRSGGYVNFVELRTAGNNTLVDPTSDTLRRNTHSFVGEVGGKIYCDIIPGLFSIFGGYEATWLDNVALAPVQAQSLTPTRIITEETPFFHSVTFGAQFRR